MAGGAHRPPGAMLTSAGAPRHLTHCASEAAHPVLRKALGILAPKRRTSIRIQSRPNSQTKGVTVVQSRGCVRALSSRGALRPRTACHAARARAGPSSGSCAAPAQKLSSPAPASGCVRGRFDVAPPTLCADSPATSWKSIYFGFTSVEPPCTIARRKGRAYTMIASPAGCSPRDSGSSCSSTGIGDARCNSSSRALWCSSSFAMSSWGPRAGLRRCTHPFRKASSCLLAVSQLSLRCLICPMTLARRV